MNREIIVWYDKWLEDLKKEHNHLYNLFMDLKKVNEKKFDEIMNDIYLVNEENIPYEQILAGRKHLKPIQAKHDDLQGEFDL